MLSAPERSPLPLLRELLAEDRAYWGPLLGLTFEDVFEDDVRIACRGHGPSWRDAIAETRDQWRRGYHGEHVISVHDYRELLDDDG
jgi:hypothetical protein